MNLIILGVLAQICFINALNIGAATSLLPYDGPPIFRYESPPSHVHQGALNAGMGSPGQVHNTGWYVPGQPGQAANENDNGKENIYPPKPAKPSP